MYMSFFFQRHDGLPFAATEAKRVWQFPLEGGPELVSLFTLRHNVHIIVVSLKGLILLDDLIIILASG